MWRINRWRGGLADPKFYLDWTKPLALAPPVVYRLCGNRNNWKSTREAAQALAFWALLGDESVLR